MTTSRYDGPYSGANEPDAHGQAALMLVESLIHALVDKTTFNAGEALTIVATAIELKAELAMEYEESAAKLQKSLDLLEKISASIRTELL